MATCRECGKSDVEVLLGTGLCVPCNELVNARMMQNAPSPHDWYGMRNAAIVLEPKEKFRNKLTAPPKTMQPHHLRHLISGTIVFFLSVGAHVLLDEVKWRWPRDVKWQDGAIQRGFQRSSAIPTNLVEVGISDDGTLVWREVKPIRPIQ